MPEDFGTNFYAATFEIVGNLVGIFVFAILLQVPELYYVEYLLSSFPYFRRKGLYNRCIMTVLITLSKLFVINLFKFKLNIFLT